MSMSWVFLGDAPEEQSIRVIHRAIELGVTLFDTADVYGPFTTRNSSGGPLDGLREDVGLATKVGLLVGPSGGYPLCAMPDPSASSRRSTVPSGVCVPT
jgi:aryl-alcohol dehydrogenase-like predicted oxidoreductase